MFKKIETKLYKKYTEEVLPQLKKDFGIDNYMALPELKKAVINMGIRSAKDDKSIME